MTAETTGSPTRPDAAIPAGTDPAVTELDSRYSAPGTSATEWAQARRELELAEVFWLSTVRTDGRPHVTPLLAIWLDGALYFCTGSGEQKARNLADNPHCVLTTGRNSLHEGLDLVIEGDAVRVVDEARLRRIAGAYESKYGSDWHFDVQDETFQSQGGTAVVFEITPLTAYGFGKGAYTHTRWRFA